MSLKAIRSRIKAKDVVLAATSVAALAANISNMSQFPPAQAAATVLLAILQLVQDIERNKDDCLRLARRAANVLLDLSQRMNGRWDSAPTALVNNILQFESVLISIRDFMQELSKVKWVGRFLQKFSIESALEDFDRMLDDAERSFQIASLIEIHYSVGLLQRAAAAQNVIASVEEVSSTPPPYDENEEITTTALTVPESTPDQLPVPIPTCDPGSIEGVVTLSTTSTQNVKIDPTSLVKEEVIDLENLGFKGYHQRDVRLRSSLKARTKGFWEGCSVAEVEGQRSIVKRYDKNDENDKNSAIMKWLHDVKTLKTLYHPNLPQLIGYSNEKAPTPFILLAQVNLRDPEAYLWSALQEKSIAECASFLLRAYKDISSAILHVQRQLGLDESGAQDFVQEATYSIDGDRNVIIGLPPPRNNNSITVRNYRLTESLVDAALKALSDIEHLRLEDQKINPSKKAELRNKLRHLKALIKMLLPKRGQPPELTQLAEELLDDEVEDGALTLSRLRDLNINAGTHDHAWHEGVHACKIEFHIGDIGYVPKDFDTSEGGTRFNNFVKLGNIYECGREGNEDEDKIDSTVPSPEMQVVREAIGSQSQWVNRFIQRSESHPFQFPGDIEGWALCLPPYAEISLLVHHSARMTSVNEAWRYLSKESQRYALKANVKPHEIMLITRSVKGNTYTVKDFSPPPFPNTGMNRTQFPNANSGGFGHSPFRSNVGHSFGNTGGFGNPSFGHVHPAFMRAPQMLYLFTSYKSGFVPFWSDNPSAIAMPEEKRGGLPRTITQRIGWPEAYIDYVQLSEEDFASTR